MSLKQLVFQGGATKIDSVTQQLRSLLCCTDSNQGHAGNLQLPPDPSRHFVCGHPPSTLRNRRRKCNWTICPHGSQESHNVLMVAKNPIMSSWLPRIPILWKPVNHDDSNHHRLGLAQPRLMTKYAPRQASPLLVASRTWSICLLLVCSSLLQQVTY